MLLALVLMLKRGIRFPMFAIQGIEARIGVFATPIGSWSFTSFPPMVFAALASDRKKAWCR